jgi:hypothetical protein
VARRRGTRRLTHPTGVAQPLDGVQDVGPSAAPSSDAPTPALAVAEGESLEDRLEKWYRERERYEKRRAEAPATAP